MYDDTWLAALLEHLVLDLIKAASKLLQGHPCDVHVSRHNWLLEKIFLMNLLNCTFHSIRKALYNILDQSLDIATESFLRYYIPIPHDDEQEKFVVGW